MFGAKPKRVEGPLVAAEGIGVFVDQRIAVVRERSTHAFDETGQGVVDQQRLAARLQYPGNLRKQQLRSRRVVTGGRHNDDIKASVAVR